MHTKEQFLDFLYAATIGAGVPIVRSNNNGLHADGLDQQVPDELKGGDLCKLLCKGEAQYFFNAVLA